ncbi:hypothetical protein M513_04207 [Trichuris suis]|uniref:Uncharacterized protein n=1 Tax=Trichuris suis TaxID=68888 RepID=A0A085MCS9_9BILA|nr:hypothetical protein M513_04207 [Trichuris suis]
MSRSKSKVQIEAKLNKLPPMGYSKKTVEIAALIEEPIKATTIVILASCLIWKLKAMRTNAYLATVKNCGIKEVIT